MRSFVKQTAFGVVGAAFLFAGSASAQATTPASGQPTGPAAAPSGPGTPAPTSDPAKLDEARQRYQRGLQLFNEANYEAARVEFERAYQLAPSYKILYNIGLCYEQLGDYVQAQSTLQRYLEIGANEISEERRAEVAKELAQIRPRIAKVTIRTNVPGAEALVDDICSTDASSGSVNCGAFENVTRTVLMNPGRRRVTLRKEGYLPETQVLSVAGSDVAEITMTMRPLPKEYKEKKSNPHLVPMWIGWGLTAATGGAAAVVGYLTTEAKADQEAAVDRVGVTRSDLDAAKEKTRDLAITTDVLLIGTGVFAIAATYFTIRAATWKRESGVSVDVGLNRIGFSGSF